MNITIDTYQFVLGLILLPAIGSFIGCFVYVKIYKWNKIKVHTKLEISEAALGHLLKMREKE
jgi:hypothetical protein